mgnify:CR=1 FL=1
MPAAAQNKDSHQVHLPPDGRQTRIEFFNTPGSGSNPAHIHHSNKKGVPEWWASLTGWFKPSVKEQEHDLEKFRSFLTSRGYSKKSCQSYLFMLQKFFAYMDGLKRKDITMGLIEDYNYDFFVRGRYSRSYQLQFINAITLYLEFAHGVHVQLKNLRPSVKGR